MVTVKAIYFKDLDNGDFTTECVKSEAIKNVRNELDSAIQDRTLTSDDFYYDVYSEEEGDDYAKRKNITLRDILNLMTLQSPDTLTVYKDGYATPYTITKNNTNEELLSSYVKTIEADVKPYKLVIRVK